MRVLLRQKNTGLFYAAPAAWVPERTKALDLVFMLNAREVSEREKVSETEIVIDLGTRQAEWVVGGA